MLNSGYDHGDINVVTKKVTHQKMDKVKLQRYSYTNCEGNIVAI